MTEIPSPSAVIDTHANYEENLERISILIGRSKVRRAILRVIYGRGTRPKTAEQIHEAVPDTPLQSIRNELRHLEKHKLIGRESAVGRGLAKAAYSKVEFIAANKEKLLRLADRPSERKTLVTKRRPQPAASRKAVFRSVPDSGGAKRARKGSAKLPKKLTVLYLTSSPESEDRLRVDAEVRYVQNEIRGSVFRDKIALELRPAADLSTILDGLNDLRPQIVHFSGHGGTGGIAGDDGAVEESEAQDIDYGLLRSALSSTDSPPRVLVLNACDTLDGADRLLDAVEVVVAMSDSITDIGATTFSARFYAAIGGGQSIASAVGQAKSAMKAAMLHEEDLPTVIHRASVDPKKMVLVG